MAGNRRLEYEITTDPSQGIAGLKQFSSAVKREMKAVENEFDDSATAGAKMAAALDKLGAQVKEDLNSAAIAAERMGDALKQAGSQMDAGEAVAQLNKMGLSFDEITQDADKLAVSLKQLDDIKVEGVAELERTAPGLSKKLDDVGKSADSSKSVLANMVGNATQDLGALGGIAGSAGVAIGQMGEYMTDAAGAGDRFGQVLTNFGKVAGPLAAIGVATTLVSQFMTAAKEADKLHADKVEDYADAMLKGADATQAFIDKAVEAQRIDFTAGGGGMFGVFQATNDLVPLLAKAGITVDQFADKVKNFSERDAVALYESFRKMGLSAGDAGKLLGALRQEVDAQGDASDEAKEKTKVFGDAWQTSADKGERFVAALERSKKAAEDEAAALEESAQKHRDIAAALTEQVDAMTAAADASIAATDAQAKFAEAAVESAKAQKDHKKTTEEKTAAVNDERDAALDAAKANERLADENAAAAGTTRTATEKVDSFNASLISNATYATPAARAAIYDYLIQVNQIPEEKATEIRAAVAAGDLDTANRLLADASKARTASIKADADTYQANVDLKKLTDQQRTAYIRTQILPPGVVYDAGGTVPRPGGLAAEVGPEFVRFPGASRDVLLTSPTMVPPRTRVTSRRQTARILRSGVRRYDSGGIVAAAPVSVNISAAVIGNRFDVDRTVTRALRRHQRYNGLRA